MISLWKDYRPLSLSGVFALAAVAERPLGAYAIKRRVYLLSDARAIAHESTLIKMMNRFEAAGYVVSSKEWFGTGRELTAYRLTSEGKPRLQREARDLKAAQRAISAVLLG